MAPELHSVTGVLLDTATMYALLRLRTEVFVVEQNCPYQELDGRDLDPDTRHLWFAEGGEVLAYLRVLAEPGVGSRIGRVCTARTARGAGLAARLMHAALEQLRGEACVLDSQVQVREFYTRFGFIAEGDEFDDDGIPHITMRRPAARSA